MATRDDTPFRQRPYDRYVADLGVRLAKAREKAHLPSKVAAERAGIHRATLRYMERGLMKSGEPSSPPLSVLYDLCRVYQIDIGDLLPPR